MSGGVPGPPNIFIRPRAMDKSIQFWWNTSDVSGYALTGPAFSRTYGPQSYTAIVKNLTNNVPYTFQLKAYNAAGYGAAATFRTIRPGFAPPPPLGIVATINADRTSATVNWTHPTTATYILGYVIIATPINGSPPIFKLCAHNYDTRLYVSPVTTISWMSVYSVGDAGYSPHSALSAPVIPGFTPSDISGITLWLDGADTTTIQGNAGPVRNTGDSVLQWRDKTGLNKRVSAAPAAKPTFSFTATNARYPGIVASAPGFATNPVQLSSTNTMTMFCVSQNTAADLTSTIMGAGILKNSSGTIGVGMDISGYSTTYTIKNDTIQNAIFKSPNFLNTPVLSVSYMDLSSCTASIVAPAYFENITAPRLGNTNLNTASVYTLASPTPHMNINEIIVYGIPLTVEQITNVSTYLYSKWGFTPVRPYNLQFTGKYGTAFSISWIGGGTSFSIIGDPNGSAWSYYQYIDPVKQTAYLWNFDLNLQQVAVIAYTPFGYSHRSEFIQYNQNEPVTSPPSTPFDLYISSIGATTMTIRFYGGDAASDFVLYDMSANIITNVSYNPIPSGKLATVSQLVPNMTYTFYMKAVNVYGSSGFSDPVTGSTILAPRSVTTGFIYSDSAEIYWNKKTDELDATYSFKANDVDISNSTPEYLDK